MKRRRRRHGINHPANRYAKHELDNGATATRVTRAGPSRGCLGVAARQVHAGDDRSPGVSDRQAFETLVLPHLDAAYNLARWLLRSEQAAQDAVQEAALRALRYIGSLRGDTARPWLLGIVRNTCFTQLERARGGLQQVDFDDEQFEAEFGEADRNQSDPMALLERKRASVQIDAALRALSPPLREVIVLREFEGLEYAQIAKIASVPIGTVMSRLSRAREKLRAALSQTGLGE